MTGLGRPYEVAVLLFDPDLPYTFSHTGCIGAEEFEAAEWLMAALDELPDYRFTVFNRHERMIDDLRDSTVDLALNLCDVGYRNNWDYVAHIPALLEILDIPYTGSDAAAYALSSDKAVCRALAINYSIPVPEETFIDTREKPVSLPRNYPVLIKPATGGGSHGISRDSLVCDRSQAEAVIGRLLEANEPSTMVLAQEFLSGPEYTVGILATPGGELQVLPPMEVDYSRLNRDLPPIFTYDAKFVSDSPYYQQLGHRRASLDDATLELLGTYCRRLFRRLGFRDYARFDFRCSRDGRPHFLDANANPTWYWNSRMVMMAEWAGYRYQDLLRIILEGARERACRGAVT